MPAEPSLLRWTPEQKDAITFTGASLLVSAAAGSGKTAVLAERCAHLVCDAKPRCNISQLLVVTFTDAAALEMKSRIDEALRKRLANAPDDEHLRRQFALIEHANISTLHSFCNRLVRRNFQRVGLDPDFRILEADEAALIRRDVVQNLFMDRYDSAEAEPFRRFIDAFGDGNDAHLMDTVVRTYEMLRSLIDPRAWTKRAAARVAAAAETPLESSQLGREYIAIVRQRLADLERDCASATESLRRLAGFGKSADYADGLLDTVREWQTILDRAGYDALATAVREVKIPKRPSISEDIPGKDIAVGLITPIQDQCKKGPLIDSLQFTSEEWQEGLRSIQPHVRVFLDLIDEFSSRYRKEKDDAGALDFADLERYAFQLVRDGRAPGLAPSDTARLLHRRYQQVLVDEYQDINELQDAILTLVSRECVAAGGTATPNLFCVGDVKQSIYGFRLAEPGLFLKRYERFKSAQTGGRIIDLQANFRSRHPLLDVLNKVFERLMTKAAVDIDYDESHRFKPNAIYPPASAALCFEGAPIELHLIPDLRTSPAASDEVDSEADDIDLERAEIEALLIAERIEEMMGRRDRPRMNVIDRGHPPIARPIEYRDIVILLRAAKYHAEQYANILRRRGIPVYNDAGAGFFDATEIRDMLALLRLLDNQRQDIPLAAVLRSPIAGFPDPEDCLARIRLAYNAPDTAFHDAVHRYASEKSDDLATRLREFFARIQHWRDIARQRPIAELLWTIYQESGYLAFCGGLENGAQRCANLIQLYDKARQFGSFSRQGLYRFVHFLESIQEESEPPQAPQLSQADNVVRIMTVHRAKGLEFPVVILPQLGKQFNLMSSSGRIVADRRAFLGLAAIDERKRIYYPSLASVLVTDSLRRQMIAEEMRILYVAMTRAREHLILVGTTKGDVADAWSRKWDSHLTALPASVVQSARTLLDWLGPVAAMLESTGPAIQTYPHPPDEIQTWDAELKRLTQPPSETSAFVSLRPLTPPPVQHPEAADVIDRLTRPYAFAAFSTLQASQSVTAWTKANPSKSTGHATPTYAPLLNEPRFLASQQILSPTERGSAVHLLLEHLDFSRPCTDDDLTSQLNALVARKAITSAQSAAIDLTTIAWLISTPTGQLLRAKSRTLLRELPLNYAVAPDRFIGRSSADPLDQVMLRGRIDLLVPDDAGWIVIDYKTDDVTNDSLPARVALYRPQLELYAEAIQRITGRPVAASRLVFLTPRLIVTL
jgi:ATP-dependent helicase/nuclease subunit A